MQFTILARDLKVPGGGASKKAAVSAGLGGQIAADEVAEGVEELDLR